MTANDVSIRGCRAFSFIGFSAILISLSSHLDATAFVRAPLLCPAGASSCRQRRRTSSIALGSSSRSSHSHLQPQPIDPSGWPDRFPAKEHCSKCGLCETSFVGRVMEACAFLDGGMSKIDSLEEKVHGRRRRRNQLVADSGNRESGSSDDTVADEARFGVLHEPMHLARGVGIRGAQWTGAVTSIALSMLESGKVDAVVCIADGNDSSGSDGPSSSSSSSSLSSSSLPWSVPEPILARTPGEVLRGRGVKPALAASLSLLDEIKDDPSIRRLLLCGVGCAVQAFRVVQESLGLEEVYVVGTNCVDNSPTPEAAERFLREGFRLSSKYDSDAAAESAPEKPTGYEFMQDFRVHVKTDRGGYYTKPYFSLPGTIAEPSIATSCLACCDYTNALADAVVGYMGAPLEAKKRMDESMQTLTVRNARGAEMVQTAIKAGRLRIENDEATGRGAHEQLAMSTVQSDAIVQSIVGGTVPESGMPVWLGEVLAFVLRTFVAPTGVNFARYSIDYHIMRNYLHMLDAWGEERAEENMPQFAKDIVRDYLKNEPRMAELKSKVLMRRDETR